jgi:hypothetical protein
MAGCSPPLESDRDNNFVIIRKPLEFPTSVTWVNLDQEALEAAACYCYQIKSGLIECIGDLSSTEIAAAWNAVCAQFSRSF